MRKFKIIFGVCIAILLTLIVVDYRIMSENFAMNAKIEEINWVKKTLVAAGEEKKWIFLQEQEEFQKLVNQLIHTYKEQTVLLEYLEDGNILRNGEFVEDNQELRGIHSFFSQKNLIKQGDKLAISHTYYTPATAETRTYEGDGSLKLPPFYKTKEGRYRIDFYLIESNYVRMGIKYISVDDVNDDNKQVKKILGERIAPGWFYYISSDK